MLPVAPLTSITSMPAAIAMPLIRAVPEMHAPRRSNIDLKLGREGRVPAPLVNMMFAGFSPSFARSWLRGCSLRASCDLFTNSLTAAEVLFASSEPSVALDITSFNPSSWGSVSVTFFRQFLSFENQYCSVVDGWPEDRLDSRNALDFDLAHRFCELRGTLADSSRASIFNAEVIVYSCEVGSERNVVWSKIYASAERLEWSSSSVVFGRIVAKECKVRDIATRPYAWRNGI